MVKKETSEWGGGGRGSGGLKEASKKTVSEKGLEEGKRGGKRRILTEGRKGFVTVQLERGQCQVSELRYFQREVRERRP